MAAGEVDAESDPLMVQIDVSRYPWKNRPEETSASDWIRPRKIIAKWQGYWISDTGATPIVLVLVRF